jgi:hypothetical protein
MTFVTVHCPHWVVYRQPAANSCYLKTGYNALISPPV